METLLRLRGSSMRLKVLFRKDMGIYQHVPLSPRIGSLSPGGTTGKHKTAARNPSDAATVANAAGANNSNNNIGSLGDYVLIDLLLGDVDLDMFVRVEAHYMRALQKKVFRAWSAAVEDVHNAIHL